MMQYYSLAYFLIWVMLLYITFKYDNAKNTLVSFFTLFMFIFVVFGLLIYPFYEEQIKIIFSDIDLSNITELVYVKTLSIVTLGTAITNFTYLILYVIIPQKHKNQLIETSLNFNFKLFIFILLISIISSVYIIYEGISNIISILNGNLDALESRRDMTNNYLLTLIMYNVVPFISIVFFIYRSLQYKRNMIFAYALLVLSFFVLIFTFQKRPLIVFIIEISLSLYFLDFYKNIKYKINIIKFTKKFIKPLFFIIIVLTLLYYSYTNYDSSNQEYSMFELIGIYLEIIFTRIFGRLSIPALLYISYFPTIEDYYGFTNVGLFSKLFDVPLYKDSAVLFSYYSYSGKEGSLAASVYIDAYSQNGWLSLFIWSFFLGIIIFLIQIPLNKISNKLSFIVYSIFSIIFVYYLSQASLFRSLLGYGGIIFYLSWLFIFYPLQFKRKYL